MNDCRASCYAAEAHTYIDESTDNFSEQVTTVKNDNLVVQSITPQVFVNCLLYQWIRMWLVVITFTLH